MRRPAPWLVGFALLAPPVFAAPFELATKIALPDSHGRIDHLAFDAPHGRLFVVETDAGSVAVVDIAARRVDRRITGLDSPQGVAYLAGLDRLFVTTHGDGMVRAYDAATLAPGAALKLGSHADNLRVDESGGKVYVGFGEGALAEIDAYTMKWLTQIPLKGHPEGFQIDPQGDRIYVNVPDAGEIAVVDRASHRQVATWATGALRSNYPMALDAERGALLAIFRQPAKIARYRTVTGKLWSAVDTCADADDAFIDSRHSRLYVICGSGTVDVLHRDTLQRLHRFPTQPGARTGLFAPEQGLLFVAARANGAAGAAIWMLQSVE